MSWTSASSPSPARSRASSRAACCASARIRSAPDPANYHWFIGNGMVHGVRLRDGRAEWYRRRFVRDDEVVAAIGWPAVAGPAPRLRARRRRRQHQRDRPRRHASTRSSRRAICRSSSTPSSRRSGARTSAARCPAASARIRSAIRRRASCGPPSTRRSPNQIQMVVVGDDGRVRKTVDVPVPGEPDGARLRDHRALLRAARPAGAVCARGDRARRLVPLRAGSPSTARASACCRARAAPRTSSGATSSPATSSIR